MSVFSFTGRDQLPEPEDWDGYEDLALMPADAAYRRRPPTDRADLVAMPYRDYLRSEHWQTQRRRALYRAGFQCRVCESEHGLEVHHLTYVRRGREDEKDLAVLCRQCHATVHRLTSAGHAEWVAEILHSRPRLLRQLVAS